jgi:hypothetical protein
MSANGSIPMNPWLAVCHKTATDAGLTYNLLQVFGKPLYAAERLTYLHFGERILEERRPA